MKIKYLKDFPNIQHHKDEITIQKSPHSKNNRELDEMDCVHGNTVAICLGHGSYHELKINEDVQLIFGPPRQITITIPKVNTNSELKTILTRLAERIDIDSTMTNLELPVTDCGKLITTVSVSLRAI